ncbi:MAG: type II toxin-antitoxin system RelE/ParE family toxin [Wenzhouxiangella sp.]
MITVTGEPRCRVITQLVHDTTDKLVDFPRIGREVPEASDVPEEVRELIHQGYRIVYWIVVDRIQILAVIHGTRDITNIERKPWDVDS